MDSTRLTAAVTTTTGDADGRTLQSRLGLLLRAAQQVSDQQHRVGSASVHVSGAQTGSVTV